MADKFVSHGDTYCGDGTASTAAASAGAVGAWNDFQTAVMGSPAHGALNSGDVLYIRTEKSSVDLTQTVSTATAFKDGSSDDSVITYIFDKGIKWAGDAGEFKYITTAVAAIVDFGDFTVIVGNNSFQIECTLTSTGYYFWIYINSLVRDVYFKTPKVSSRCCKIYVANTDSKKGMMQNCYFEIRSLQASQFIFPLEERSMSVFDGCTFDLQDIHTERNQPLMQMINSYGHHLSEIRSLRILGDWEGLGLWETTSHAVNRMGYVKAQNIKSENGLISLQNSDIETDPTTNASLSTCTVGGAEDPLNMYMTSTGLEVQYKAGKNYPTVSAVLPDGSNTYWAYKIFPRWGGAGKVFKLTELNKLFTATAATRKLTTELLISDGHTTPKKHHWWLEISYIDSTDNVRFETSYDYDVNLVASTAVWSAEVYGEFSYDKYKIDITTTYAIKEDTLIYATLMSAVNRPSDTDFYFVCPELTIQAP